MCHIPFVTREVTKKERGEINLGIQLFFYLFFAACTLYKASANEVR